MGSHKSRCFHYIISIILVSLSQTVHATNFEPPKLDGFNLHDQRDAFLTQACKVIGHHGRQEGHSRGPDGVLAPYFFVDNAFLVVKA